MSGNGIPVESSTKAVPAEEALAENADKALGDSVRSFLRDELKNNGPNHAPTKKEGDDLRPLQMVFLIAFAIDITFFYFHLIGGEENEFLAFLYKLLPALGGTLAVRYFDRLRVWLFKQSSKIWLGTPVLALAVVLLAMQWPIYSALVQLDPPGSSIQLDGKKAQLLQDGARTFLLVPKLRAHRVSLRFGRNPKFEYEIGLGSVLKGTLARLPLFNRVKFMPVELASAYSVNISCPAAPAQLYISAPSGLPLENSGLSPVSPTRAPNDACLPKRDCWSMAISTMVENPIVLPGGTYTFVEKDGECTRGPVTETIGYTAANHIGIPSECR
jgi:hypothetical protein